MHFSTPSCFLLPILALLLISASSAQYEEQEEELIDPLTYLENPSHYQQKSQEWIDKDYTLAAGLIRLHFHDCAVRGCDASILLDHPGSERWADASKTLRGFQVIDDIKAEVERKCPKTVSCADILTAAARDATILSPAPGDATGLDLENVTALLEFFQSKGLNVLDLVVLSGAHTIGRTTCGAMQHRLYDFHGTGEPDPSISPKYLKFLRRKCRWASEYVDLDAITPRTFDVMYYKNLQHNMGLLATDQMLGSDSRTSDLVATLVSKPSIFYSQFAMSMEKLGNTQVLTGEDGEIRVNCNFVNP
ncbi:Peroxidase 7 [Vitis vinifera]|uniref:Peroxidase n=1 Tax=Vitis vinifera TaxID=29760 RepID=A0A438CE80_VITVI|nr:Peroxidase 7 [Vitis vinifera]